MMYHNKFVVAVKVHGAVLREFNDQVYVPFGSEYSLLLKNLNSGRALVSISIDGVDIADGEKFVIHPDGSIDIERFVTNNHSGNRFKFIERTSQIEHHRGIGIEDGLIRVAFQFERKPQIQPLTIVDWDNRGPWRKYEKRTFTQPYTYLSARGVQMDTGNNLMMGSASVTTCSVQSSATASVQNDVGITVPGSISNQRFVNASSFDVYPEEHVIVLKMVGKTSTMQKLLPPRQKPINLSRHNKRVHVESHITTKFVDRPITVKSKQNCIICGNINKMTAKFCSQCGSSLVLL